MQEGLLVQPEQTAQGEQLSKTDQPMHAEQTVQTEQQSTTAAQNLDKGQPMQGEVLAQGEPVLKERPISQLLDQSELKELESQLKQLLPENKDLELNKDLTARQLLDKLSGQLDGRSDLSKEALGKLFSGKEYHALLKDVIEQQWTVMPEELKTKHKVQELYERLDKQMGQLENLAKEAGLPSSQLSESVSEVRNNIEFMNHINQAYTYVQIPLKMANQNAHSDLYVYTNKRNLRNKEGELSAFLHLDLDNLGSTDVSIKMLDKKVTTKFYLSDDAAYDLVEEHLPQLEARLEKLGYNCTISLENREEKVDFVEDFLKSQKTTISGTAPKGRVHRYSFDVRA